MGNEIKNTKFRKLMNESGLSNIQLIKGEGYFYIAGEGTEFLSETSIFIYSFNQQSPEEWGMILRDC